MLVTSRKRRRSRREWVYDDGLGQFVPPASPVTAVPAPASSPYAVPVSQGTVKITDPTVVGWATNPQAMAQREALEFLQALEVLRDDSKTTAAYLRQVDGIVQQKQRSLDQLKAQLRTLQTQGMGELIDAERQLGLLMGPSDLSGLLSSVRKGFRGIDKAVFRPAFSPLKEAGRAIDKAVIRPWSQPLNQGLQKFEKAAIRPWSSPIGKGLQTVDKAAIRPVAKTAARSMAFMDKYVPGWMTLLDFTAPIPLGTILGGVAASARGGKLIPALVGSVLPGSATGGTVFGGAVNVTNQVAAHAFDMARPVTQVVEYGGVAQSGLNYAPWTLSKGTYTFIKTKGPFFQKLQATAFEALSGYTLAVNIAATVVSGGAFLPILAATLTALQTGITVLKAKQAADALKKATRQARQVAQREVDRIAAEEAAYLAEIAKVKAQIAEIRRKKAEIEAARRRAASVSSSPVSMIAEKLGVPEAAVVAGGLAAVAGAVVVVSMLQEGG